MTRITTGTADRGHGGTGDPPRRAVRPGPWAGRAACAWALSFAVLSFYWAAGGTAGHGTIGPAVEGPALAREPSFVALLWATAVLKLLAAALALALGTGRPRWAPRRLSLVAGWGTATLLSLYGVANLAHHLLIAAGAVERPAGLGRAVVWHLLLWDPVWIAGGLLFTLATVRYSALTSRLHTGR